MKEADKITGKMLLFCQEYLVDLNATKAAIRAGYSEKTAYSIGSENLRKPEVQKKIAELQAERARRVQVSSDFVIRELLSIATDDIKNYIKITKTKAGKIKIELKDLDTVDTKNISEVTLTKEGFRFKRYGRDTALVQLGRHLGLFEDKVSIKGNLEKLIAEYSNNGVLTDEGLKRLAELLIDYHQKFNNEQTK